MTHVFILPYEWVIRHVSRERIIEILSDADISKAERFIHQADHDRYISARLFLFGLLKQRNILSSNALDLSYSSFGKPFLTGIDIKFNWSHSGDMIALIMSSGDCGIDIEQHTGKELYDYRSLCTEPELKWLSQKSEDTGISELVYFIDLWTAKESVVKAKGTGLYTNPRYIEIRHEAIRSHGWKCNHDIVYHGFTKTIEWEKKKYALSFCTLQNTNVTPIFNPDIVNEIMIYI